MSLISQSPAWLALSAHRKAMLSVSLRGLFVQNPDRFDDFSLQLNNMLIDFSKQPITKETMNLLLALARQQDLEGSIKKMFQGERVNTTENRAAMHHVLRGKKSVVLDGEDASLKVKTVLEKMRCFTSAIHNGDYRGHNGKPFTDVVNFGIGGSDLGPAMVTEALRPYWLPHLRPHFVSNIDGSQLFETLNKLDPATTLFIVASKTFTSQETLVNAEAARQWFVDQSGSDEDVSRHFVAVTTAREKALKFGIHPENIFEFWDWVGGRFSLWSAIGLPIALTIGMERFNALLNGARIMDEHFATAPLRGNIPVILGLIAIWHINFLRVTSHAILPYAQHLQRLPAYLQQLEMESNGKRVTKSGEPVDYSTGITIWGEPGANGQHAFYQLLHQGTQAISADFLAPCQSLHPFDQHHRLLLANFFAQTEALMCGRTEKAQVKFAAQDKSFDVQEKLPPHKVLPGNHPTTSILFRKLDPETLGMLIAMYEHKVFVQSVIWEINPFDQWGVELGKQLAGEILKELEHNDPITSHDASTNGLINFFKKNHTNT